MSAIHVGTAGIEDGLVDLDRVGHQALVQLLTPRRVDLEVGLHLALCSCASTPMALKYLLPVRGQGATQGLLGRGQRVEGDHQIGRDGAAAVHDAPRRRLEDRTGFPRRVSLDRVAGDFDI